MKILIYLVICNILSDTLLLSSFTEARLKTEDHCYHELGCFPNTAPWFSVFRPFPSPLTPSDIDVQIYLYTTNFPKKRFHTKLWTNISIDGSDFDPKRPYTTFITHGFATNGNASWTEDLKDGYLKKRDANVFIVDWGKGASFWNYLQVAANTRIVGAELIRLGKYLIDTYDLNPKKIHLIGHSLGAHVFSYMGKGIEDIGQITALDPAQPGFEGTSEEVRLNKKDAKFIDVIHTNAHPIVPFLGFGLMLPTGDIDYYINGGLQQPGCFLPSFHTPNISNISDLGKYTVEVLDKWISCSHRRAYEYYIEALQSDSCIFWGRYDGTIATIAHAISFGLSRRIASKFSLCTLKNCSPIGLENQEYPARGTFTVKTHYKSPYCRSKSRIITQILKKLKAEEMETQNYDKNNLTPTPNTNATTKSPDVLIYF